MQKVLESRFWRTMSWLMMPAWMLLYCGFNGASSVRVRKDLNHQFYDAAWAYDRETQQELLDRGADINWQRPEFDRNTVLSYLTPHCMSEAKKNSVARDDCHQQMRFLLKNGANPNLRNRFGQTARDRAAQANDAVAVRLLDRFGARH